jgi:hypothetical protein
LQNDLEVSDFLISLWVALFTLSEPNWVGMTLLCSLTRKPLLCLLSKTLEAVCFWSESHYSLSRNNHICRWAPYRSTIGENEENLCGTGTISSFSFFQRKCFNFFICYSFLIEYYLMIWYLHFPPSSFSKVDLVIKLIQSSFTFARILFNEVFNRTLVTLQIKYVRSK